MQSDAEEHGFPDKLRIGTEKRVKDRVGTAEKKRTGGRGE
jgi:hypothetical protein